MLALGHVVGPHLIDKWLAVPLNACIGLAVPGRPIGPWSPRTGAPEASATGRDRCQPVHGGYTRCWHVEECNGYQRSPRELRNRRSDHQRSRHQAALHEAGQGSSLPTRTATTLNRPLTFASAQRLASSATSAWRSSQVSPGAWYMRATCSPAMLTQNTPSGLC